MIKSSSVLKHFVWIGISACLITKVIALAQLPVNQLYMFDIAWENHTPNVFKGTYLSSFASNAYINQVHFIDEDQFYFVSDFKHTGNPNIFKADLNEFSIQQISSYPYAEFSPKSLGNYDSLFCVTVMQAAPPIQQIHRFPLSNALDRKVVLDHNLVGYYDFKNRDTVVIFELGDPPKLVFYDLKMSHRTLITENPGYSFKLDKNQNLWYVHKVNDENWLLKKFNWLYVYDKPIPLPRGVEEFALTPEGGVLVAQGSKLFFLPPGFNKQWREIVDLAYLGLSNLRRPVFSPGFSKLVLVSYE